MTKKRQGIRDAPPSPETFMSEATGKTKYWLGAVIVPSAMIALTYAAARLMPTRESDWLGGRFLLLALVGTGAALLSSIVLTFTSVKKREALRGLAVVSCILYLGLFLKTVL